MFFIWALLIGIYIIIIIIIIKILWYSGLGEVLDEKFELAKKLTYNTLDMDS